ncbi:bifunctional 2-keto-4-hydroxyglutarate aldolase/2-keto-3-deoxy-6-phosphogluconate aldolase [Ligilactobacillus equi]|uniref:bifunctional 2-keto-4-hydroxyglutarate aldolase/2-keto-3-deoxy-6-phosphogluconate aldolase n=1 Tax=Ligilactobacillus equi TaxID=137357 RepID=UPI002ED34B53
MTMKTDVLTKLTHAGVVAVVRGDTKEEALQAAQACIEGGVTAIELTFTVPNVEEVIAQLAQEYRDNTDVVIGAGTVLDAVTARIAIMAGAKFIVSPSFSKEVAKVCNLYTTLYTPGCFTPTEVQEALVYGSELVKIFPGSTAGIDYIKSIHGPFPQVEIMPSGGVSLENMDKWFANGALVVGVGGNLTNGTPAEIKEKALAYRQRFEEIQTQV